MRPNLVKDFRSHFNNGYTYQELIALRAAGHDFPDHWIINAKQDEDAAALAAATSTAIAADLKAAEKLKAEQLAAIDAEFLPKLNGMAEELPELEATAAEKRAEALEAVKAYRAAYRAAAGKYGAMRRIIQEGYGEAIKDVEGNPLPGQTYNHWQGNSFIEGRPINPPSIDPAFNSKLFHGM